MDLSIEAALTAEELEELLRDLPEFVRELEADTLQNTAGK
ncbi:hypothetical protein SATMO3_01110 [Sporomusa aerivorans]